MKSFDEIRHNDGVTVKVCAEYFVGGYAKIDTKIVAFVCTQGHLSVYSKEALVTEDIHKIKEVFFDRNTDAQAYQKLEVEANEYVFWEG